jgi:hypothetical protein
MDALHALRQAFPLEQRLATAPAALRRVYGELLATWGQGRVPPATHATRAAIQALSDLDAVVIMPEGLGCYPYSARATGIHVAFARHAVHAMCAVDALAIARLVNTRTRIDAGCAVCTRPVTCHVEANGGLAHEQVDRARVLWQQRATAGGPCSDQLCRQILFLCQDCAAPDTAQVYTLPQATAVANAFFSFQRALLPPTPAFTHDMKPG